MGYNGVDEGRIQTPVKGQVPLVAEKSEQVEACCRQREAQQGVLGESRLGKRPIHKGGNGRNKSTNWRVPLRLQALGFFPGLTYPAYRERDTAGQQQ